MQFLRESVETCEQAIAQRIGDALLQNQRVLWLTSGGSNIALEVNIMKQLHEKADSALAGLAIMPMDERYGKPGHADSNTQQLREAGFEPGKAIWIDVLSRGLPLAETVEFYRDAVSTALAGADVIVGQFGLGTDGHVAGILPASPATEIDEGTIAGYEWSDYTRLTLTAEALRQITVAYVPAYGASKKTALERLEKNQESFENLPAKILYEIAESYVYNEFITTEE